MAEFALDGLKELEAVIETTEYGSVLAAVAAHARFVHPDTVAETGGSAVFPIVRWQPKAEPGLFQKSGDINGRRVVFDDNTSPRDVFLWAAGLPAYFSSRYRDYAFNHIWDGDKADDEDVVYSRDAGAYTALWNVCATPAFLAKTTDSHPKVRAALRFHAYKLYAGARPAEAPVPEQPDGYDELPWRDPLPTLAGG